eukprot:SAG31_NODE_3626_length_4055_cov_16.812184_3_plen_300_part_00
MSYICWQLVASLSDMCGRKPVLIGGLAVRTMIFAAVATVQTPRFATLLRLRVTQAVWLLTMVTFEVELITLRTIVGDVYPDDAKAMSNEIGQIQAAFPPALIVGPLIGGALAARDVRLAFWFTALTSACSGITLLPRFTETFRLATNASTSPSGFSDLMVRLSPLVCLQLFRKGKRLSTVAVLTLVYSFVDEASVHNLRSVHELEVSGWSTREHGVFTSFASLLRLPSGFAAGGLAKRLGALPAFQIGFGVQLLLAMVLGRARTGRDLYLAQFATVATPLRETAINSLAMFEASQAGIA